MNWPKDMGRMASPRSLDLKAKCRPHSDSTVLKSNSKEKCEKGRRTNGDSQFWEDIFPET